MTRTRQHSRLWLSSIGAAVLTACGGGGGSSSTEPPTVTPAAAVTITGSAVDGPLQGATACYDLNDNGRCDSGEPTSAASDANGQFSLSVAAADAGRHRLVVEVPATAVDKDTGLAVGTAFTLVAPASGTAGAQAVFVSPLTTLVQAHADSTGVGLADAAAFVQAQAGLAVSPLADFTAVSSAANTQARLVARVVQLTTLAQAEAVKDAVDGTDLSGAKISKADVDAVVVKAVIAALPTVAALVADPALASASGTALTDALKAAAGTGVAGSGLTAASVAAAVGVAKLPAETVTNTATAGLSLTAFSFTDDNNWYYRSLEASAADNVPDAAGKVRYYSVYRQSRSTGLGAAGVVNAWGSGGSLARSGDVHWTGSAWAACPLFSRSQATVRDAAGRSSYDYCDGFEQGNTVRKAVDIAGKPMADVFANTIRPFKGGINGGASGVAYANWGPADLGRFNGATFPAGAKLLYQNQTPTQAAYAYDVQDSNWVLAYAADIAAGGDARSSSGLACAAANTTATAIATLDDLVARNPGKPCVFGKGVSGADSSLDPNEWWSNSTASLGIVSGGAALPAGTGNWYNTDLRLRVAFTAGSNATTYYSCLSRASSGSSRNCTAIGTGSFAIQTLGDARVMRFNGLPAITQKTGFTRVFVERGGKVFFGYQNPVGASTDYLRLNTEATHAVFKALGMGVVQPVTRVADLNATDATDAAAMAAVQGVWGSASDTEALVLRFGANGRFLLGGAGPAQASTREQTGGELGWYSYDSATYTLSALTEVDSNLTAGTSHPQPTDTLTLGADQITTGDGTVLTRLVDSGTGIVGLWALGSASEFKTQHFAFFGNGRMMMLDPLGDTEPGACLSARQGPPGGEFASYSYVPATGALRVFAKQYDTNGCAGLFDSTNPADTESTRTVQIAADGKTATVAGGSGPVTLYRIAPR